MIESVRNAFRDVRGHVLKSPRLQPLRDVKRRLIRRSEGESLLLQNFALVHGRPLELANPQTFTEKTFCRMVRWNRRMDPRFTLLADKFAVRSVVTGKVGEEHVIKLLWHGTEARQIPFDRLPTNYVVKTNHGSGYVVPVRGNADRADLIRRVSEWMTENYYWRSREYQYFRIVPQVMVEEYLTSPDESEVTIYRFWCFDGKPRVVNVDNLSHTVGGVYDLDWNRLPFTHMARRPPRTDAPRPPTLGLMIDLASSLSEGLDFVRVDLYSAGARVYFSELTFTPGAGTFLFQPIEWDLKIGQMWNLRD
jgi:hypothetical protein